MTGIERSSFGAQSYRKELIEKLLTDQEFHNVIAEEGDETVRPHADHLIEIPSVSTLLQPLLSTIPLQVFAASVAQARGYDVDKPRNLAKSVTVE